ncbi:Chalcone-flavonone isomerase family protein [Heracleum sosnowskyi]|uniref:Chalcone-flavonone isomerase family protein n=1 Tax=Heracleum sosnowskyi TaxID=360622 RepID=A0AAD8GMK4_9APIA|nr:Chalcone-flavonone isomerase family protein [Heracleum sosnowskyi]
MVEGSIIPFPAEAQVPKETAEQTKMGTEVVMVDGIPFPPQITASSSSPLSLLAHGITDIEIHFLQIKFTAIGVYLNPEDILPHLNNWKGKTGDELAQDDDFFDALITARADKFLRIVVIKEIKGSQYGVQVESAVRDRLAEADKYEDEEEAALDQVVEFFQSKYFKKDSVITFYFPATAAIAEIGFSTEGKESNCSKITVENGNVVEMLQKWYLGGSRGVSPTTISSIANSLSTHLCIPSPSP